MTPLLSIAAGVCPETGPADFVEASAEAGWDACGIWFDPDTWSARVAAEVRRRLDDSGLVALDIEPVFVLPDGDGGTTDHGDRIIEAASVVGARNILVVNRGAAASVFVDRFAELCDEAATVDVHCVVEFMAFMSTRTLADAVEVVSAAGRQNAGVLVDNLHLARTGSIPSDVSGLDPRWLPYVQLCDAPADGPDDLVTEALDGRCAVGEGGLPIAELLAVLPEGTPLSMEVRSRRLRTDHPNPTDRARALLESTRRFFDTSDPSRGGDDVALDHPTSIDGPAWPPNRENP